MAFLAPCARESIFLLRRPWACWRASSVKPFNLLASHSLKSGGLSVSHLGFADYGSMKSYTFSLHCDSSLVDQGWFALCIQQLEMSVTVFSVAG